MSNQEDRQMGISSTIVICVSGTQDKVRTGDMKPKIVKTVTTESLKISGIFGEQSTIE